MPRYVAFLRGINLGGRRIKNEDLRSRFVELGLRRGSRPSGRAATWSSKLEGDRLRVVDRSNRGRAGRGRLATRCPSIYARPKRSRESGPTGCSIPGPGRGVGRQAPKVPMLHAGAEREGPARGAGDGLRRGPARPASSASSTGCRAAACSTPRWISTRSTPCSASRPRRTKGTIDLDRREALKRPRLIGPHGAGRPARCLRLTAPISSGSSESLTLATNSIVVAERPEEVVVVGRDDDARVEARQDPLPVVRVKPRPATPARKSRRRARGSRRRSRSALPWW